MCVLITLSILPKDFFHLLLCLKQPALLLQFSLFRSIQTPTCLPVSLPLSKRKSIFRKNRELLFFFFASFISLHLWAHSLEKKGARLMGPRLLRDFAPLYFLLLIFSPVFFTGRICDEGKESNRNKQVLIKRLGDSGMNKLMQGEGAAHSAWWWAAERSTKQPTLWHTPISQS